MNILMGGEGREREVREMREIRIEAEGIRLGRKEGRVKTTKGRR